MGGYVQNRYDPEGLRYELLENGKLSRFIFSGREVVAEVDANNSLKAATVRGHEILAQKDARDNSYYYLNNAHGDVVGLMDAAGNMVDSYKYDAFGNIFEAKEQIPNRFRYAGEQFDAVTGQYYLRARFYNPVMGRFTQEDTYRNDGLNLYAYVQNNPVKYVDPSGYSCESKSNVYAGVGEANTAFASRKQAFNQIKKDLDIPSSQQPISQKMIPLTDANGNRILDANKQPIMSRELTYEVNGKKIVIQDHSAGHDFGEGGIGNQPSHFNVRPADNTRTGKVEGTQDHYYFENK